MRLKKSLAVHKTITVSFTHQPCVSCLFLDFSDTILYYKYSSLYKYYIFPQGDKDWLHNIQLR